MELACDKANVSCRRHSVILRMVAVSSSAILFPRWWWPTVCRVCCSTSAQSLSIACVSLMAASSDLRAILLFRRQASFVIADIGAALLFASVFDEVSRSLL